MPRPPEPSPDATEARFRWRWRRGPEMEITARAAVVFSFSSAVLTFVSLPIDGYLRPDRLPVYVGVGVGCLLLAAYTGWSRRLSDGRAAVVIFSGTPGSWSPATASRTPGSAA